MKWVVIIAILFPVVYFLYRHCKKVGDANELEWLDKLTEEYDEGRRDNRQKIERLMRIIEENHKPSVALDARLDNVRRMLAGHTYARHDFSASK